MHTRYKNIHTTYDACLNRKERNCIGNQNIHWILSSNCIIELLKRKTEKDKVHFCTKNVWWYEIWMALSLWPPQKKSSMVAITVERLGEWSRNEITIAINIGSQKLIKNYLLGWGFSSSFILISSLFKYPSNLYASDSRRLTFSSNELIWAKYPRRPSWDVNKASKSSDNISAFTLTSAYFCCR